MTKLSDFLQDLRDSENIVSVRECDLRKYAQQSMEWEKLAKKQGETILALSIRNDYLQGKLKSLMPDTIDLFA